MSGYCWSPPVVVVAEESGRFRESRPPSAPSTMSSVLVVPVFSAGAFSPQAVKMPPTSVRASRLVKMVFFIGVMF